MRKYLLHAVAAAAVLATGVVAAPAAHAAEDRPECEIEATWDGGAYADATIAAVIPLTAGTNPSAYPVSAVVTCSVVVSGSTELAFSQHATGVAVIADTGHFRYDYAAGFKICTTIDYTSNANATDSWCVTHSWSSPSDTVFWLTGQGDFAICPALEVLAPQTSPDDDVYITPEGDVYVLGVFFWDCPPYETG